jgi:hypothetical protein
MSSVRKTKLWKVQSSKEVMYVVAASALEAMENCIDWGGLASINQVVSVQYLNEVLVD